MIDKASGTGWVVEVVVLTPNGPPSFKYFNVAISDAAKAVAAMRQRRETTNANPIEIVRQLSAAELPALKLKTDQIKLS